MTVEPPTVNYSTTVPSNPTAKVKEVMAVLLKKVTSREKADNYVISLPFLLSVLSELVRSYSSIATFIAEYQESGGEKTILGRLISDMLIPEDLQNQEQVECAKAVSTLISTLASSNHAPKAQEALVDEVKLALNEAYAISDEAKVLSCLYHFVQTTIYLRLSIKIGRV